LSHKIAVLEHASRGLSAIAELLVNDTERHTVSLRQLCLRQVSRVWLYKPIMCVCLTGELTVVPNLCQRADVVAARRCCFTALIASKRNLLFRFFVYILSH